METKELRDFIRSNEMRYFVVDSSSIHIAKAFKVNIVGAGDSWIHFAHGIYPEVLKPAQVRNGLFKSRNEAKAYADKLRARREKEKAAKDEELKRVTEYLNDINIWDFRKDFGEIRPQYQPFVDAIKRLFEQLRRNENKSKEQEYIAMLERYIRTGVFYSHGLMFRKEQVVQMEYGKDGSVRIRLANGTEITPAGKNLASLLMIVFGNNNMDGYYYTNLHFPYDGKDEIKKT